MHHASYYYMGEFAKTLPSGLKVLDVGSKNVLNSGTYKPHFGNHEYTGCDLEDGDNVDVVLTDPYALPFADESFDVVISGQVFEHVEFFWLTAKEIARVVKKGGYACIIVPSTGQVHRFPVDCWRFYEDGMRAIAKWMGFEVIEARITDQSDWNDAILIAKK